MSRRTIAVTGITLVLMALVTAKLWQARSPRDSHTVSSPPHPLATSVLLVTVDTLRADRLGAYGYARARTPNIDAVGAAGVRFDRAYATAPITLTSHASLLTGLYPPGHGGRHNGVPASADVPSLATSFSGAGWATGAFVSAYPLDRRFGLARGFDRYGDAMPRDGQGRQLNERPGRVTVDEAIAWLRGIGDRSAFLWVHLFEPHAPYEPEPSRGPAGIDAPLDVRYDDEVARADSQVGRLLDALGPRRDATLVVFAGDHGEAFGEHGEFGHSVFVYDTTLRVPLILAGPGVPAGCVVSTPVSLVDIVPTVLAMTGRPPADADGLSLAPLMQGEALPARELYAESFAPLLDFGWSSLRSIRSGGRKYIAAPRPELYDVEGDPAEQRDLIAEDSSTARSLAQRIEKYSGAELPVAATIDKDSRERLRSIGYFSGHPGNGTPTGRADPKDRRELANRLAQVAAGELRGPQLRRSLEGIIRDDPGNGQAHLRLGYALVDEGQCLDAERHFRSAIEARVPTADPHLGLAVCLGQRGDARGAERALRDAQRAEPGNPVVEANLGIAALSANRVDEAIGLLQAALTTAPDLHQARFELARALAIAGRRAEALDQASDLLGRLPAGAPQRGEVERMIRALQQNPPSP